MHCPWQIRPFNTGVDVEFSDAVPLHINTEGELIRHGKGDAGSNSALQSLHVSCKPRGPATHDSEFHAVVCIANPMTVGGTMHTARESFDMAAGALRVAVFPPIFLRNSTPRLLRIRLKGSSNTKGGTASTQHEIGPGEGFGIHSWTVASNPMVRACYNVQCRSGWLRRVQLRYLCVWLVTAGANGRTCA